jgi:hypothetical protein
MFWDDLKTQMSEEDRAEYQRICNPESEDFILNSPDYYCALTYTIFLAQVPEK